MGECNGATPVDEMKANSRKGCASIIRPVELGQLRVNLSIARGKTEVPSACKSPSIGKKNAVRTKWGNAKNVIGTCFEKGENTRAKKWGS